MSTVGKTVDIYCRQCSNRCCAQIELDEDDVVVNAYRIVPGRITQPWKKVPSCRNLVGLLGLSMNEALEKSKGS